jgi:hypothetical protein
MDKIASKLTLNPTLLTYGMIGITTVILAALTVFDSNTEPEKEEPSYVSQLFQSEEQETEPGLLSSILPQSNDEVSGGGKSSKTRRNKKKHANRKTRHRK